MIHSSASSLGPNTRFSPHKYQGPGGIKTILSFTERRKTSHLRGFRNNARPNGSVGDCEREKMTPFSDGKMWRFGPVQRQVHCGKRQPQASAFRSTAIGPRTWSVGAISRAERRHRGEQQFGPLLAQRDILTLQPHRGSHRSANRRRE